MPTEQTELELTGQDAITADELATIQAKMSALKAKEKKLKKELLDTVTELVDPTEAVVLTTASNRLTFSKVPETTIVTSVGTVARLMGEKEFIKIARISAGDAKKALKAEDFKLVTSTKEMARRITIKPIKRS